MPDSVLAELERRVRQGVLADDPAQRRVAERLDRLANDLDGYSARPPAAGWRKLLAGNDHRKAPRGLYIHGDVGRGKTMLMDLFHAAAPVKLKRRAHFHVFMRDVHARIHAIRQQQRSGHVWDDADPIAMVADNDLALGMLVEAVSKSAFWKDTAIFVLEDDAQNGPDHVDSHRSPVFVISPYVRRGNGDW